MILGLDLPESHELYANNVENVMVNKILGYSMPIVRKYGHMYLEWTTLTILFTRAELKKIHLQFKRPHLDKVMIISKRSEIMDVGEGTRPMLEEIGQARETSMMSSRPLQRFRVTAPLDNIVFNDFLDECRVEAYEKVCSLSVALSGAGNCMSRERNKASFCGSFIRILLPILITTQGLPRRCLSTN